MNANEPNLKKSNEFERETFIEEGKAVKKDQWGNDIEFLLSCITLSVGLGNVWRYVPLMAIWL